jgi:hypothetical protein
MWKCCAEWLYYYLKKQAETRRFERRHFVKSEGPSSLISMILPSTCTCLCKELIEEDNNDIKNENSYASYEQVNTYALNCSRTLWDIRKHAFFSQLYFSCSMNVLDWKFLSFSMYQKKADQILWYCSSEFPRNQLFHASVGIWTAEVLYFYQTNGNLAVSSVYKKRQIWRDKKIFQFMTQSDSLFPQ